MEDNTGQKSTMVNNADKPMVKTTAFSQWNTTMDNIQRIVFRTMVKNNGSIS